jgi:hypothetical protein
VQSVWYTEASSPTKPSEDFVLTGCGVAVVLDGLGTPAGLGTGCQHGTRWYTAQLGFHLARQAVAHPGQSLTEVTAEAIDCVSASHADTCDLDHPGTPSSSVTVLRVHDHTVDYLVLHDSTIVLDGPSGCTVVTDVRGHDVVREEHEETQHHRIGSPAHSEAVRRLVTAQRPLRNHDGGYWVAAATPDAAYRAITGSVERTDVRRAALLTDGASSLVDCYQDLSWSSFLDMLEKKGPKDVVARVRELEKSDPEGIRWPRYKTSDDATAAICLL